MSASLEVALDTTPPTLTVEAARDVKPPEDWVVVVRASEAIGMADAALLDPGMSITPLGIEHLDDRTLRIVVPTVGLPGGRATLMLRVTDEVLNSVQTTVAVFVLRETAFHATLDITGAYSTTLETLSAYDVMLNAEPIYSITLEVS